MWPQNIAFSSSIDIFKKNSPLQKLFNKLKETKLDALLVCNQSNITYLSGFPSRESWLLLCKDKVGFFITDFRYLEEAKSNLKGFIIKRINGSVFSLLANLIKSLKIKRLGFEAKHLSFAEYNKIKEALPLYTDFISTYDIIESLREIKSKKEIDKIKEAIKITIDAFKYAKCILKEGITEKEIANQLEFFIKQKGCKLAFEIIVASGPNSSFPHYITSNRKIQKGEPILIDMGIDYQGYKSDLTRVFFLGKIPSIIRKIYQIVLEAQQLAIKKIKVGLYTDYLDKIARQYINCKGYSEFFGHSLGHGIGLDVHEGPSISLKHHYKLKEGMVFTVEPAIYLPKRFGIRIEDVVLVKRKGVEVLSEYLYK
ncbi:MAG: Xaa-Pro peptidase family protein [Candidatus Omnitrophica bacterium]|nr:Xaa-Pro peptidase family protein [Candidatus Omnitrophota bacterium]MCM8799564.1 Xaa-Pro peptidase family protein [Candidatus Omnitrophota bacterium]